MTTDKLIVIKKLETALLDYDGQPVIAVTERPVLNFNVNCDKKDILSTSEFKVNYLPVVIIRNVLQDGRRYDVPIAIDPEIDKKGTISAFIAKASVEGSAIYKSQYRDHIISLECEVDRQNKIIKQLESRLSKYE